MTSELDDVRQALASRYSVEREIGRGASAVVYLAVDVSDGHSVAVKVLHTELAQALGGRRFLREIVTAAALEHPNLLPIHDSGHVGDVLYYVSPYMAEGSLRSRLIRERQLSVEDALRIATEVGAALDYVHSRGIVHRDVKPENILFSDGCACVADFGIARAADVVAGETITSTGLVVGTPTYMSPEQASADATVDARSDQYSLACVLYEMIAGVPPFVGATAQSVIAQRFSHAAPPLSNYRPTVPRHVEAAIERALSLVPADRFASIAAFIAALHNPADAPVRRTPSADLTRRRRWFASGAATAAVVLAVLGFGPARARMTSAFFAAPDTTRFAVVPFAQAASPLAASDVSDAVYRVLRQWDGLNVVSDAAVRDAVADGSRLASLEEAFSIAASVRAGRLVWGRVSGSESAPEVSAALYDVRTRRPLRDATAQLTRDTALALQLEPLVDVLLQHPELRTAPGWLGTRSYPARRAYEIGAVAFARGSLDSAKQHFAAAVARDPQFSAALLRLALVSMLTDEPADSWRGPARRVASETRFPPGDRNMALALAALAEARYPEACAAFARAQPADSTDFAAWYGLGECLFRDSLVVPSRSSPSGWAFRSSHHSAARAYLRALDVDERTYSLPIYARLRRMLKTEQSQLRSGWAAGDSLIYAGYPVLQGDTLAFVPYPVRGRIDAPVNPTDRARALERNSAQLLGFARAWVERRPAAAAPLLALADVMELRGEVTPIPGELGPLEAVRRVRGMTTDRGQQLDLELRQFRLLVRSGAFAAASALADTVFSRRVAAGGPSAGALQATAALTGRVRMAAELGAAIPPSLIPGQVRLPPQLNSNRALLEARAAAGSCATLQQTQTALIESVEAHMPPEQWDARKNQLLSLPAMWAASCTNAASMSWTRPSPGLGEALAAYAAGERARARRALDSVETASRAMRPGDISLDYSLQATWLRAALGDTAAAVRQLDRILESLSTHRSTLFTRMSEAAALPRAMLLRAELAAAAGDTVGARRWAASASDLWRNCDAELNMIAARARALGSP